jgi:uncharacterized lipoprotein YajG
MTRLLRLLTLPLSALLLTACATGPTRVLLDPEVLSGNSTLGAGQAVELIVSGNPSEAPLFDNQSRFGLDRPATVPARTRVASGLAKHGFQIVEQTAERQFQVIVLKSDHVITRGVLRDTIVVETAIQFTAMTPAGSRTRTFNDKRSREVGGRATLGEVSGEMNQSLGHVLGRALNDAELIAFLAQ